MRRREFILHSGDSNDRYGNPQSAQRIATLSVVLALSGCAPGYGVSLQSAPVDQTETFNVEYRRLAECSYVKLEKIFSSMLKKTDLYSEGKVRIAADGDMRMRYWELVFSNQGQNQTLVSLTTTKSMWGSDAGGGGNKVLPEVKSCASLG